MKTNLDEIELEYNIEKIENRPWKPAVIYMFWGLVWILFSDKLLSEAITNRALYESFQTFKGLFYVIFTGVALYFIIKVDNYRIFKLSEKIIAKNSDLVSFSEEVIAMDDELSERIDQLNELTLDLFNQKHLVEEVYNSINTVIIVWSLDGKIINVNRHFEELFDFEEDVIGKKWTEILIHNDDKERMYFLIRELIKNHKVQNYELNVQKNDESILNMVWNFSIIQDSTSNEPIAVSFGIDITSEVEKEIEIINLATKDQLTSLNGRSIFDEDVNLLIDEHKNFTLYMIDIDDFKYLNDLNGHMYGDIFLKKLATSLKNIDEKVKIYRWGGDEILILEEVSLEVDIESTVLDINNIVGQNWDLKGLKYQSTASIGIVKYPQDGVNLEQLFSNLDIALNQAKIQGKSQHQYYSEEFIDDVRYKIAIENGLEKALENNDLELLFQPVCNLKSEEIAGVEVLLRWPNNPINEANIGNIINVAEKTGQILKIDKWVIDNTFKTLNKHKEIFRTLNVAVNISTQSFYSEDFYNYLKMKVKEYSIDTKRIKLEITEYSIISNFIKANEIMLNFKSLGFRMALDDFGTKYSSLNYLIKLPFDTLKIDKSYIDDIMSTSNSKIIVEHIIKLASKLGLEIIVEGIEFREQMLILDKMGCKLGQGYYMSRPIELDKVFELIRKNNHKLI